MSDSALVPVEQKNVAFYDDEITAVLVEENGEQTVYVPIRPICDFLGVRWNAQFERINRDIILTEVGRTVRVIRTEGTRQVGRKLFCLPIDYLNGWLFGISVERVKPEFQDRIVRYQRECYKVLAEAFREGRLMTSPSFDFDALLKQDTPEVQIYKMLAGMTQLARQQILMQAQVDDHETRLQDIEHALGKSDHFITRSQAMEISQAVKAIALEMGKRSKKNEFGGVYGELYRKYEINSYKELPAARFDEAMGFLNDWLQVMIGDSEF